MGCQVINFPWVLVRKSVILIETKINKEKNTTNQLNGGEDSMNKVGLGQ